MISTRDRIKDAMHDTDMRAGVQVALDALFEEADDYGESAMLHDLCVRAGIMFKCRRCGWYNVEPATTCEANCGMPRRTDAKE